MRTNTVTLSHSHIIIVPSYNSGALLERTFKEIMVLWQPVIVVIDGSDDGSDYFLSRSLQNHPMAIKVIKNVHNQGKGAAILKGAIAALQNGYTHALIMDADNQHSADSIFSFMQISLQHPKAMILGDPIFDASAPSLRVQGRKVSNFFVNLETFNWDIHDSLFGMRVYPLTDLIAVMQQTLWARRFDFEPEIAVRLAWRGLPIMNIPTPVRYIDKADGGITHFRYFRDNTLLTWMHIRLLSGFLLRLPNFLARRFKSTC